MNLFLKIVKKFVALEDTLAYVGVKNATHHDLERGGNPGLQICELSAVV